EGVRHESAVKQSWKLLCQSTQQQANTLLRFETLMEEHANLIYAHASAYDHLSKNYDGALTCEKILQDRLSEIDEEKKKAHQLNSSQADLLLWKHTSSFLTNDIQALIKLPRMYLLDPSDLQNIMADETGPTPGGGPRNTPMASYA
ncbi:hypothetical protein Tco_0141238, partial [Tanacetum coccineum]